MWNKKESFSIPLSVTKVINTASHAIDYWFTHVAQADIKQEIRFSVLQHDVYSTAFDIASTTNSTAHLLNILSHLKKDQQKR